jgi:nucleotide-binding universal stress UspA family protein
MSFKDILVPLFSVKGDDAALVAAEVVAEAMDGHVTALLLEPEPDPVSDPMLGTVWPEFLQQARANAAAEKLRLDQRAAKAQRVITTRELSGPIGFVGHEAGVRARSADLTIMLRPGEAVDLRTSVFEGVLFGSGRPLLLTPPNWSKSAIGRNVVIGWNGERESARAVADAAPFLERADSITIVAVGSAERARAPGDVEDLLEHFTRRGLKAGVRVVGDLGYGETAALFAEAAASHADLLVMGGYGRSRLGEFIFGGVTREASKTAPIPVLMSH